MKPKVKEKVLAFMESTDTSNMSSNEFYLRFADTQVTLQHNYISLRNYIELGPSVESILRSRRKVISDHGIGARTNADTEEEYIEEFARSNKF